MRLSGARRWRTSALPWARALAPTTTLKGSPRRSQSLNFTPALVPVIQQHFHPGGFEIGVEFFNAAPHRLVIDRDGIKPTWKGPGHGEDDALAS